MLCEECRERPATVHLTRIVNNQKAERHLCEACARDAGEIDFVMEPKFSIHNLLAGLLDYEGSLPRGGVRLAPAETRCDLCGQTYRDFTRTGRLGCNRCWDSFAEQLEPLLRRIHASTEHSGKVPGRSSQRVKLKRELKLLRARLDEAIKREEFEQAALLRDRIRAAEQQLAGGGRE